MISGIYTALMLLIFIGIFLWAWSSKNQKTFESLAHLPLEEKQNSDDASHSKGGLKNE